MTRQELKDALLTKDKVMAIVNETSKTTEDGLTCYTATVRTESSPGAILYKPVVYYVENEGQPDEIAYWQNKEPFPTIPEKFHTKVSNYIETKIQDGTIDGAVVTDISEENRSAFVRAVRSSDKTEIRALIADKNNDDTLELTVLS